LHVPAASVVTVPPWIEHTDPDDDAIANTNGLLEPVPVADTVNVPLGLNTGAAGLAAKLVIEPVALGVTLLDAADATLVPAELVAVTVKVYAVPSINPVIVHGELVHVPVRPPGLLVAV
jgi:hypothetical protein